MKKVKIVIVDDSPFSIALLRDVIEGHGFEVVGEAGSLEEVKQIVKETKPDLVTMDMTLPGTDGLECTRAIHQINSDIKVIIVSSMMDEEIINKAKENKTSGYIQKPVDEDELVTLINRVMADDEDFIQFNDEYFPVFKEALLDAFNKMTKTVPHYIEEHNASKECNSRGISVLIGIIGKYTGKMILDLSMETAENLTKAALKRQAKNKGEVLAAMGEIANIICGNACSVLNKKNKIFGLRVAPPSILYGECITISPPEFSTSTAIVSSNFGELLINIGFKRGDEKWMQNI